MPLFEPLLELLLGVEDELTGVAELLELTASIPKEMWQPEFATVSPFKNNCAE
jgi:hypothetical protein